MAMALPLLMLAGGVAQGVQQKNAADSNAATDRTEASVAAAQGYSAEATQRRQGAMAIGREVAGAGQAGAGYQGSTGRYIQQNAMEAEQNALNVRYKANLQKWSYDTQGSLTQQEGKDALATSTLRAGASLLKGYSSGYASAGMDLG